MNIRRWGSPCPTEEYSDECLQRRFPYVDFEEGVKEGVEEGREGGGFPFNKKTYQCKILLLTLMGFSNGFYSPSYVRLLLRHKLKEEEL